MTSRSPKDFQKASFVALRRGIIKCSSYEIKTSEARNLFITDHRHPST